MIAIDYLKTRAIYDAYAKKNALVNFMNPSIEEDNKEEGEERDHGDLLYEFGDQLKTTTMGSRPVKLGNFTSSVNMSTVRDTLNRKSSVFRTNTNLEGPKITAHDLLPKLKLLYKVGMVSFMHHLDQKNFKNKVVIAKSANSKQGNVFPQIQFPHSLNSWDYRGEIDDGLS